MPAYYSAQEIAELQFPDIQRQASGRSDAVGLLARTCLRIRDTQADAFKGSHIDAAALSWASACATSRAYRVRGRPGERGGHLAALLPVVDLINHAFEANCILVDAAHLAGPGAVAVTAARDIRAGESLRTNYGDIPNDQLLLNYGFVLEENDHDRLSLPAGALSFALQQTVAQRLPPQLSDQEAHELTNLQTVLLQQSHLLDVTTLHITHTGEVEETTMALVRVLVLQSPAEAAAVTNPLHVQETIIEERARLVLFALCTSAEEELGTSIEHDLQLLATATVSHTTAAVATEGADGGGRDEGEGAKGEGEGEDEGGAAAATGAGREAAIRYRLVHKKILRQAAQMYAA
mmetsp:Transcript_85633/g.138853  ORF Transcript_85633/g.138853 Transcript_85633/m.138853 type:complete len:349 (+) Transcript_85633:3-1049(+)